MIPFGPWLPDQPPTMQGAASIANNVIPSESGYRPVPSWVKYSGLLQNATTAPCQGAGSFISQAGTIYNFAGTHSKLYMLDSTGLAWNDITRLVGGAYTLPLTGFWTFSQFGDVVFAQNGIDTAQKFTLDVSANFINDAGIPIAQFTFTIQGFSGVAKLALANSEVDWSGIYDPTNFVPSDLTLSDGQFMPDGGSITGAVGGEVGIIFQQRAISRMSFAGPPLAFRFDKISTTLGCKASRSIAQYGDLVFFLSANGMYMVQGATNVVPIGDGKIDLWLQKNLDSANLHRISAAISAKYKIYVMGFPSISSGNGVPDTLLIYHWPSGKWSTVGFRHYFIYQGSVQAGYNLDTIDVLSPIGYPPGNIDTMDFSFDSDVFSPVPEFSLAAFSDANRLGYFTGQPMLATIETGDIQLTPGKKSMLMSARPLINGENVPLKMSTLGRDRLQDNPIQGDTVDVNDYGIVPQRINARYHRMLVTIGTGVDVSWDHAIGIDEPNTNPGVS